jgi:hypothetical protein
MAIVPPVLEQLRQIPECHRDVRMLPAEDPPLRL